MSEPLNMAHGSLTTDSYDDMWSARYYARELGAQAQASRHQAEPSSREYYLTADLPCLPARACAAQQLEALGYTKVTPCSTCPAGTIAKL